MKINIHKMTTSIGIFCLGLTTLGNAQAIILEGSEPSSSPLSTATEIPYGFHISGDFLYWSVREDGLAFAKSGVTADGSTTTQISDKSKGEATEPDFDWHPGFRIGIGFAPGGDGWDISGRYTWLNSPSKIERTTQSHLAATWNYNNDFDSQTSGGNVGPAQENAAPIEAAQGRWSNNLNTGELNIGRPFLLSQCFIIRPYTGLKASWQKQDYLVSYEANPNARQQGSFSFPVQRIDQTSRFFGLGLDSGLNTSLHFSKHWGVYSNLGVSGLASRFHVDTKVTQRDSSAEDATIVRMINFENETHSITPVLEAGLGISADYLLSDQKYHLGASLGWEQQTWFNMNRFADQLEGDSTGGNLVLQGITFNLRFDF